MMPFLLPMYFPAYASELVFEAIEVGETSQAEMQRKHKNSKAIKIWIGAKVGIQ